MNENLSSFQKADKIVVKVIKAFSYVSAVSLILIMLIAFFNVIGEKLAVVIPWMRGIPMSKALIQYLHIPVVFMAAGFVTLDHGHTRIDLLSSHFPHWLEKAFITLGHILGAGICGFISYRAFFILMVDHIQTHAMISSDIHSIILWPFTFVHGLGFLLLAISFVWSIFRQYSKTYVPPVQKAPGEEDDAPAEEEKEENA